MKLAAMMLAVVAGAVCVVSSLGFMTSPGTPPRAFGRSALARTASQPTPPRPVGDTAVGAVNIKVVVGEEEKHFETPPERKKRKKVENLRKEKIQRARDRKFKQQKF